MIPVETIRQFENVCVDIAALNNIGADIPTQVKDEFAYRFRLLRYYAEPFVEDFKKEVRAAVDKHPVAAQAHVQAGGMHQQGGAARPGLAIDIHDGGFGDHAHRFQPADRVNAQLQVMRPVGVRLPGKGFNFGIASARGEDSPAKAIVVL